jgi:hypothetical protein
MPPFMLPNFIGIGPTKTATTWLFACLREHPQVFLPAAKETQFFVQREFADDLTAYERFFHGADDANAVGEISPRYFASPEAPQRIKRHLPGVKLIVTLRDPVERLESEYWHLRRMNVEVGDAPRNVPDTLEAALQTHAAALLEPSLYATHLNRWLAHFDRAQIHIIFGEDVRSSPARVIRSAFEFLEVDARFVPAALHDEGSAVRKGVSPRSPMFGRVYTALYSILVRGVYRPVRRLIGLQRASAIKDALRARQVMSAVFHREGYPTMDAKTRTLLRQRFADDVRELEALTGRDLSAWRA